MRVRLRSIVGLGLALLAPRPVAAQFGALRFTDIPAPGAWAEYELVRQSETARVVSRQKLTFLGVEGEGDEALYRFQVEMTSSDFGPKPVPVVSQLVLRKPDALARRDYFRRMVELVVQVGDAPAFRIGRAFLERGLSRNAVSGGLAGPGSEVDYQYEPLEDGRIETPAGAFSCRHLRGRGEADVQLAVDASARRRVRADAELWWSPQVPFGLVRQHTHLEGDPFETEIALVEVKDRETVELVAHGGGGVSAIRGPVIDYNPSRAATLAPVPPAEPAPAGSPAAAASR